MTGYDSDEPPWEEAAKDLSSDDYQVRSAAARYLASIPVSTVLSAIKSALFEDRTSTGNWVVKISAIKAILETSDV